MVNKMNLQESILKAVNTIVEQRTNELKVDKTITAIIEKNMGTFNGKTLYRVMYEGGFLEAVVLNSEEIYLPNTSVYVLVPQGNFSKEKIIIGRTNNINVDNISSISTNIDNEYCLVGSNLLYNNIDENENEKKQKVSNLQYGVYSYHSIAEEEINDKSSIHRHNPICFYDTHNNEYIKSWNRKDLDQETINIYDENLGFNIESFNILKEQATALMLKADFKTNLTTEQRQRAEGEYGLILDLVFENPNKNYGNTNGEIFEKISDTVVGKAYLSKQQAFNFKSISDVPSNIELDSYDYYDIKLKDVHEYYINQIKEYNANIETNISSLITYANILKTVFSTNNSTKILYTPIVDETLNKYLQFLDELALSKNLEDFNERYTNWWKYEINDLTDKVVSYIISSNEMMGNPLSFNQWSTQYKILNIDMENFIRVNSIILYQKGFLQDSELELTWPLSNPGPDIFVKNLQLYPVKKAEDVDGDYSLKIQPRNSENNSNAGVLISTDATDRVIFEATFMRKKVENLSKNTNVFYSWFREDFSVIDEDSIGYNALAGPGWRRISLAKGNVFAVTGNNNLAYKNNYKCVVQYKENNNSIIVLSSIFTVYNKSIETSVLLESNIGTSFIFGGKDSTSIITCKINENFNNSNTIDDYIEVIEDEEIFPKYTYCWAVVDTVNDNRIFLDNLNQLSEENMSAIEKNIKNNIHIYYDEEINDKEEIIQKYKNNKLVFNTKDFSANSGLVIECFVKKKISVTGSNQVRYVNAGSARLEFLNKGLDLELNTFKLVIENGNQVFQYDEYGIAPDNEKNKEPLNLLPIHARLFAPSGIEISNSNYSVEWIFPSIEKTMIFSQNGAEIDKGSSCSFNIAKIYNPNFYDNQITCHVIYNGQDFFKDTNFLFTKIGENGTNGTDVVAKIDYIGNDILNKLSYEPLTIYIQDVEDNNDNTKIIHKAKFNVPNGNNTMRTLSEILPIIGENGILDVTLYQRGEVIPSTEYAATYPRWTLLGNSSYSKSNGKYFNIIKTNDSYFINWDGSVEDDKKDLYQIIKAEVQLKTGQIYYATYNLPFIWYTKDYDMLSIENPIAIDRSTYLSSVLYNADGRNPIYNHNQGLKFINIPTNVTKIIWEAKGKVDNLPCFNLITEDNNYVTRIEKDINLQESENLTQEMIYILPNDIYDGGITNNYIKTSFYSDENLIAIAYVPIYMSLNTFGLASLNAWDGNHLTVNEDEGYIVSPQIGAGEKDNNNRFTGILMGKTEGEVGHTENTDTQTGLFGYIKGTQSIFLDAKTGNATFGLPNGLHLNEQGVLEKGNNFNEGRIELKPGGESKIGGWTLGNRSIYYTSKKENGKWVYSGALEKRTKHDYIPNWKTGLIEQDRKDSYFKLHEKDIKYDEAGILLYAGDSPYISIKGRPFTNNDIPENENSVKEALIKVEDSLELQLDPATPTLFTIFRHNGKNRQEIEGTSGIQDSYEEGSRTFLAGINSQGEFIANSLRNANTSDITVPTGINSNKTWPAGSLVTKFAVNALNAFDDFIYEPAKTSHIGFEITANEKNTLAHFFTKINGLEVTDKNTENAAVSENYNPTLHISGGYTDADGEYSRPLALHGRNIQMYALDGSGKNPTDDKFLSETDAGLKISKNEAKLQLGSTCLNLFRSGNDKKTNILTTTNDLKINVGEKVSTKIDVKEYCTNPNEPKNKQIWKTFNTQSSYDKYKKIDKGQVYEQVDLEKVQLANNDKYISLDQINNYTNNNELLRYYIDKENNNFILLDKTDLYYKYKINKEDYYISINSYNNDIYYINNNKEIKNIEDIYQYDKETQSYISVNKNKKSEIIKNANNYYVSIEKSENEKIAEQYRYISENDFLNNIYYINENDENNYINIDNFNNIYYKKLDIDENIIYINKDYIDLNQEPFIILTHEENKYEQKIQHYFRNMFDDTTLYFKINYNQRTYYVTQFNLITKERQNREEEWEIQNIKSFYAIQPDHNYWYNEYYNKDWENDITAYFIEFSFIEEGQWLPTTIEFEISAVNNVDFNKDANFDSVSILNIYKKYNGDIKEGMYPYILKEEIDIANLYYYYSDDDTRIYSNLNNENNKMYYKLKDLDSYIEILEGNKLFYFNEEFLTYIPLDQIEIEGDFRKITVPKTFSDYKWINLSVWGINIPNGEGCLGKKVNSDNYEFISKKNITDKSEYIKENNKYLSVNDFKYIFIRGRDILGTTSFFVPINTIITAKNDENNYWLLENNKFYDINDKVVRTIKKSSDAYLNKTYSLYAGKYISEIEKSNAFTGINIDDIIQIENTRAFDFLSNKSFNVTVTDATNEKIKKGTRASKTGEIFLYNNKSNSGYRNTNQGDSSYSGILGKFTHYNTSKEMGLILNTDSVRLTGDDSTEIESTKKIEIAALELGPVKNSYSISNPQIRLIAGQNKSNDNNVCAELILNSSSNSWGLSATNPGSRSANPIFRVKGRYGSGIKIIPEILNKTYKEYFEVNMDQAISNGLSIQGLYADNVTKEEDEKNKSGIGLYVTKNIKARKFIGKDWNSIFTFTPPNNKNQKVFGSSTTISGVGGSGSFNVPIITIKTEGQPGITTETVSISIPSAKTIFNAIKDMFGSAAFKNASDFAPAVHSHSQYALKGHSHDDYVKKDTYKNHTHNYTKPKQGDGSAHTSKPN